MAVGLPRAKPDRFFELGEFFHREHSTNDQGASDLAADGINGFHFQPSLDESGGNVSTGLRFWDGRELTQP